MTNEYNPESPQALPLGSDAAAVDSADARQYVTFLSGDEVFAVEMAPVQEIIRVPDIVRVPLSPPSLEGLANLRGKVLPIVSLRRALGFDERASDDASRAVVIDIGQPMGFVVDRVSSVVGVDPSRMESVDGISSTINSDLLTGLIKDVSGHPMVMVLNFQKLIEREFAEMAHNAGVQNALARGHGMGGLVSEAHDDSDSELHLVSFDVADRLATSPLGSHKQILQTRHPLILDLDEFLLNDQILFLLSF